MTRAERDKGEISECRMSREEFIDRMMYSHHYLRKDAENVADIVSEIYKTPYDEAYRNIDYAISEMARLAV